jgi:hypothetical protein
MITNDLKAQAKPGLNLRANERVTI